MIHHLIQNPHYRTGSVVAKLAANLATGLWAVIVLVRPSSLRYSAYPQITELLGAHWLALLLSLSVTQALWLFMKWAPRRFGSMGYAAQCFFWTVIMVLIALADGPVRAAPVACVSTVVVLCAFAFVTGPKDGQSDGIAL